MSLRRFHKNLYSHCLTKNLPRWVYSIDGGDGPRITSACHCSSRFPAGRLGFSAYRVEAYGFVMADSVQESGAAAPGKCRRCSVQDWPGARRRSAPTLPQRGLCGCAASPAPVFSAPALDTRSRVLLSERGALLSSGSFPAVHCSTEKMWRGPKGGGDERRATDGTAEHRLLQLLELVQ